MEPQFCQPRSSQTINIGISLTQEKSQNTKVFQFTVPYFEETRAIRINQALGEIIERQLFRRAQLFLYDHSNRVKVFLGIIPPFEEQILLGTNYIIGNVLHLSYRQISRQNESSEMIDEENIASPFYQEGDDVKKSSQKKARERTIEAIVQAVRQWRTLYDTADSSGKRLYTLDEAARKIGISKKTLDDYFIHIRIAAKYGFNFQKFRSHKVGLLRRFVKVAREEGQDSIKQKFPECIIDNDTDKYWVDFDQL